MSKDAVEECCNICTRHDKYAVRSFLIIRFFFKALQEMRDKLRESHENHVTNLKNEATAEQYNEQLNATKV